MGLSREELSVRYRQVRAFTEKLCEPLETEDYVVQSMPDASPVKWHLGHTSWFFETFVLRRAIPAYEVFDGRLAYVFNSYYRSAGDRHPQPRRGLLSRPTVARVYEYRHRVDEAMCRLLEGASSAALGEHNFVVELGLHHEQQHQELILTDLKHAFAQSPGGYRGGWS
jgi:hypothetical protein